MPKFKIVHTQAVWEESVWEVEAKSESEALEIFDDVELYEESLEPESVEITGNVEYLDSERYIRK